MKNQKSGVANNPPVDRNHLPLAVLALAAVFRELRERRRLSLNRLAARAQVARQSLSSIEKQEYYPTAETIARVAAALDFSFGEFGMRVDHWMSRQPRRCRACRYSCMVGGKLIELNSRRQCTRPPTALSAPAATLPISR